MSPLTRPGRSLLALVVLGIAAGLLSGEEPPKPAEQKPPFPRGRLRPGQRFANPKPFAPPAPRSALLKSEDWQRAPLTPATPAEIDRLVLQALQADGLTPAPLTTDEQFVRRVTLDLTGELPDPADVTEFAADPDPRKRSRLIDRLLDSDEYAAHWAHYWRDVIVSQVTDFRVRQLSPAFDRWLTEQFRANRGWGAIVRDLVTAEGEMRFGDAAQNGQAFFLLTRRGADAANERAAEVSRVFLGIQIQCAQCHDHPFDQWKRVQFHELAAYFARTAERPVRDGQRIAGVRLVARPFGEHEMASTDDPKKTYVTLPRFLNGKAAGGRLGDLDRRRALAAELTARDNYWFAAAFVNRVWGELLGQAFTQPVDDMGPGKEVILPEVLTRLTGAFRGTDYDVKALFRTVLNTEAYQRQVRLGDSADEHLRFAAAYPTRLRADALWQSLNTVLGSLGGPPGFNRPRPGLGFFRFGLEALFKEEFHFDPSLKPDEVEGSIPQALLLMNSPVLHQKIQARGTNLLARILSSYREDDDAIRMVYLKALARKPTDRERQKCLDYIKQVGNRAEAYEDLLWALINSTEFQTKR